MKRPGWTFADFLMLICVRLICLTGLVSILLVLRAFAHWVGKQQ